MKNYGVLEFSHLNNQTVLLLRLKLTFSFPVNVLRLILSQEQASLSVAFFRGSSLDCHSMLSRNIIPRLLLSFFWLVANVLFKFTV